MNHLFNYFHLLCCSHYGMDLVEEVLELTKDVTLVAP